MLLSLGDLCLSLGVGRSHLLPKDTVILAEGMQKKNQRLVLFADFKAFRKAVGIIHLFLIYFCVFIWSQVQKGEAIPCQVPQW